MLRCFSSPCSLSPFRRLWSCFLCLAVGGRGGVSRGSMNLLPQIVRLKPERLNRPERLSPDPEIFSVHAGLDGIGRPLDEAPRSPQPGCGNVQPHPRRSSVPQRLSVLELQFVRSPQAVHLAQCRVAGSAVRRDCSAALARDVSLRPGTSKVPRPAWPVTGQEGGAPSTRPRRWSAGAPRQRAAVSRWARWTVRARRCNTPAYRRKVP